MTAQETYEFFPEDKPEMLIGYILTPEEKSKNSQTFGYDGFFKPKKKKWVAYDGSKSGFRKEAGNVDYNLVFGKKFRVDSVEAYQDKGNYLNKSKYWIYMTELGANQPIRYDYDPAYEFKFEFRLTEEMKTPDNWFCKEFSVKNDKFNGETRISTPYNSAVQFIKYINGDETRYYMNLAVGGSTLNTGESGVKIILDNGELLDFPGQKIEVEAGSRSGWVYSAFMEMDDDLRDKLMANYVTDFRLYIYDAELSRGKEYMAHLNCLVNDTYQE